jgi:hypothetical protein
MTASSGPALKRLSAELGDRVVFLTLYVREAQPGERYPQPQTFEEKLAHARAYQARDQIPWPVVVDDITGSLHQTLDAQPDAAYRMDIDGIVAFRALWAIDERVVRQVLQAIVSGQPSPLGENQEKLIPMLKGMGVMYEIIGFAGKPARWDVAREVPPMYAIVRLAALFRPLPPLGRSLAAITIAQAGMLVLITSLRQLLAQES